jgi:hypothetical protein
MTTQRKAKKQAAAGPAPTLREFIEDVEAREFRTETDAGAHPNALLVWNQVREFAGLPRITREDLAQRHIRTLAEDARTYLAAGKPDAAQRAMRTAQEIAEALDANDLRGYLQRLRDAAKGAA